MHFPLPKPGKLFSSVPFPLLLPHGIHHPPDPIRIRREPERPVKPENLGLRVESDVGDPTVEKLPNQPLHHGLPQSEPLVGGVHHDVPDDGVEDPVAGGTCEGDGFSGLGVLDPEEGGCVVESLADLGRVAAREADADEDSVEVVEVEGGGGAVEDEAAREEVGVGDGERGFGGREGKGGGD